MLNVSNNLPLHHRVMFQLGEKLASEAVTPAYALSGALYVSNMDGEDWGLLSVPNALVRGVFSAMDELGVELPPGPGGSLNAHITVFRPDELDSIGGADKLTERGKRFGYTLGRLVTFEPSGWPDIAQCWALLVHSPELQQLRRSYGLSSIPRDGEYAFHVTVAVRRKGVLGRNDKAKGD